MKSAKIAVRRSAVTKNCLSGCFVLGLFGMLAFLLSPVGLGLVT